jgi:hypothetical protein
MALAHCILGKFLWVTCHCFPPPLDVPTFAARCLYVRNDARDPSTERWNCGREICPVILPKFRVPLKFRDLLHAAWDRRLYFPSEGRHAEDFFALKIWRLRLGLNPRTWVLKASTLPLDYRSRISNIFVINKVINYSLKQLYFLFNNSQHLGKIIGHVSRPRSSTFRC